jgi:hypothetical protein
MEKIDLILWIVSGGFGLMLVMWHTLNKRIDDVKVGLESRIDKLDNKVDRLDERLRTIDTHVAVIENNLTHLMWREHLPPAKEANSSE